MKDGWRYCNNVKMKVGWIRFSDCDTVQQHSTVNRKVNGWNTPTINNTIVKCQTSKKGWALACLVIN
jgi:hypothetical protein